MTCVDMKNGSVKTRQDLERFLSAQLGHAVVVHCFEMEPGKPANLSVHTVADGTIQVRKIGRALFELVV